MSLSELEPLLGLCRPSRASRNTRARLDAETNPSAGWFKGRDPVALKQILPSYGNSTASVPGCRAEGNVPGADACWQARAMVCGEGSVRSLRCAYDDPFFRLYLHGARRS